MATDDLGDLELTYKQATSGVAEPNIMIKEGLVYFKTDDGEIHVMSVNDAWKRGII